MKIKILKKGFFGVFSLKLFFKILLLNCNLTEKLVLAKKWPNFTISCFKSCLLKFHLHIVLQIQNTKGMFGSAKYCTRGSNLASLVASPLVILPDLVATRAVFCTTKRLRRLVFIYYLGLLFWTFYRKWPV